MSMGKRTIAFTITVALLASCGDGTIETGPGGVSDEDAKALDEAATKLDTNSETAPAEQQ